MLHRIGQFAEAAGDLLDARARLALRDLEETGKRVALRAAGGVLVVAGGATMLGAAGVALGEAIGLVGALATLGGVIALAGVVVLVLEARGAAPRPSREQLELETRRCTQALRAAFSPTLPPARPGASSDPGAAATALVREIAARPALVCGAGFAILAVLGPVRTLRLIGKLAAMAGVAASMSKALHDRRARR